MVIVRPLTVLVHELGHGLPALLLTKEKVKLFIGSHGDPYRSVHFQFGRLEIYFKYNPILWNHGLCVSESTDITINKQLIIILFGPIASLSFGISTSYYAFANDTHGSFKLISIFIFTSSLIDFFQNIIPRKNPIQLFDGSIVYNDGEQLKQVLKYKTVPSQFNKGVKYYNNFQFPEAAKQFHQIINNGIKDEMIYRVTILSYIHSKNFKESALLLGEFKKKYSLN